MTVSTRVMQKLINTIGVNNNNVSWQKGSVLVTTKYHCDASQYWNACTECISFILQFLQCFFKYIKNILL